MSMLYCQLLNCTAVRACTVQSERLDIIFGGRSGGRRQHMLSVRRLAVKYVTFAGGVFSMSKASGTA